MRQLRLRNAANAIQKMFSCLWQIILEMYVCTITASFTSHYISQSCCPIHPITQHQKSSKFLGSNVSLIDKYIEFQALIMLVMVTLKRKVPVKRKGSEKMFLWGILELRDFMGIK